MDEKRMDEDMEIYLASNESAEVDKEPSKIAEPTSESARVKKNKPKTVRVGEIPEFRERNKKRFRMSDGTEQEVFYTSDIHVFNEETGQFDDIEDTITEDEDGKHFTCGRHCFVAKFSNDENDDELFSIEQNSHKVTVFAKKNSKNKSKGRKPDIIWRSPDSNNESKIISFSGIQSNSKYEYTVEPSGVKENIVVSAPRKTYRYAFTLKCENVRPILNAEQKRVAFVDVGTNEEIFHIPAPFMVDGNGISSTAVSYKLVERVNSDPVLTIVADANWMNDIERAFPIVIDPQITVSGTPGIESYSWQEGYNMTSASVHRVGVLAKQINNDLDYSGIVNNDKTCAIDLIYDRYIIGSIPSAGNWVYYKFTANASEAHNGECIGRYTFYTTGNLDTVGYLYDANNNKLASNDDNNGLNFGISAYLTYGETYYLKVNAFSNKTGTFKVSCIATDRYCCGEPLTNTPTHTYSRHRMYMSFTSPTISVGSRIKKATLVLKGTIDPNRKNGVISTNAILGLYPVNGSLDDCCYEPYISGNLIDYDTLQDDCSGDTEYRFDITSFVDRLNSSEQSNNKFVLKLIDESITSNNNITLYGANSGKLSPKIEIEYEPNCGVNASYPSHTHTIGKFGQAAIDLKYGNLTIDSTDFSWAGNRMPVTIKHLYNSMLRETDSIANFSNMNVGTGFRLNIMQSILMVGGNCIYTDENGAETILTNSGSSDCMYKNDDADMSYDACCSILTVGDEQLYFEYGRLKQITSGKNTTTINYTSGRISSVVDAVGRTFEFNYLGNNLVSIKAPDNSTVRYTYSGNKLSSVTYPDETSASIAYNTSGKPASITVNDSSGRNAYMIDYKFSGNKVTSVSEFGFQNDRSIEGAKSEYSYSPASNRTIVTTFETDEDTGECNEIKTVYTFDDDGNIISDYVYSKDTGNTGVEGEVSGIHPYSSDGGASIIRNNTNLLYNHTFANSSTVYWYISDECCSSFSMNATSLSDKFRNHAMGINSNDSTAKNNTVYQNTVTLSAGEYTFSAYVKVDRNFSGTNAGAYIRVSTLGGSVLAVSEKLTSKDSQYIRLIAPFKINYSMQVKVEFVLDGSGKVYVCAPQLENNPYANDYNMLQNGNFEMSKLYWNAADGSFDISTSTRFNMSRSMYMSGNVINRRSCYQTVYPISDRSTRETFTLSGWAKGYGLPMHDRNGSRVPTFRLRAVIKYYDTAYREHGTEEFTADFSPCTDEWQFTSLQFSKSKYRAIEYICVYCDYDYNQGTVYFDDIQLIRNSLETGLTSSDFDDGYAEDNDYEDTDTSATDETEMSESFTEATDTFGNTLTETTFTDGEFGTIYRSFGFTEDGNDLITETDARGNKTTYEVDKQTSRNKEVTDRLGNKTAYEYDGAGRTTKVTSKNADGVGIADVSYAYDAFDNMTEIVRGDGMKYALKYNEFHNLKSIGIEGKNDGDLITYTYKNGNGRLKEMTYANGDTMKATYNSIGQMVAEKWYNSTNSLTAHYKYTYDGAGNIVRSIDITGKKEYNYEYEEGRIVRATEADIELNGEIVIEKTVVNTVKYYYDSEGNMTKKVMATEGKDYHTVHYENSDDNTVVKFSAGDRTVTSHSKTDSFGRKVFDELQIGTGFVSREFDYIKGEFTEQHEDSNKLKSSPTTQLVSRILLSDGRILEYEYDAEERITKVIDSLDGTTEYTYDALGQLLTERLNGHIVNSMTYDTYGNITSKNGKTYTYGNANWKDQLTSFDGENIDYDAQGNPVKYLGHTLTWEKGRQLKKFDENITFNYNANGIRTSKTVNGVKHEYTLDGTKILRETWGDNTLIPLYDNEDSVCGILYNSVPYYFVKNLQGDVIAITNSDGKVVATYSYDAWGVCTIVSDNTGIIANINPFRYRTYYFDKEIGLYYLQSRYYNATVGRFLNSDDIENLEYLNGPLDLNLFTYTVNCPILLTDGCGEGWLKDKIKKVVNKVKKAVTTVVGATKKVASTVKNGIKTVCTSVGDFFKNTVWKKWIINCFWDTFCKKWIWEKFCKEMVYNTFIKKWVWQTFCKKWTWETFCKKWVWQTFCKKWVWETFCKDWIANKAWNWLKKAWNTAKQFVNDNPIIGTIVAILGVIIGGVGLFVSAMWVAVTGFVLAVVGLLLDIVSKY